MLAQGCRSHQGKYCESRQAARDERAATAPKRPGPGLAVGLHCGLGDGGRRGKKSKEG